MTEAAGTPARRAALRLLDAVLRRSTPLDAARAAATRDLDRAEDRALAIAIASEALRRLPDLDALIDGATRRPLPRDAGARGILRVALVQALVLGTPPHAAIATALPLAGKGPRRLVHGVFGALMRQGARLPEVPTLPRTVARRWQASWGKETVAAAARLLAGPPPLDLIFKSEKAIEQIDGESLAPLHKRVARGTPVEHLPGYESGDWWVQDIAASIPARLLGEGGGRSALDLAAAPGGKTMQLAAAGFRVAALDASESRLRRLSANLKRTGLEAKLVKADLMEWSPDRRADAILLDAPCSATGIFRRHPDVLHRARPGAIADLARMQRAMLGRAAGWLKPGGTLVYAVCSLEREEGEEVARAFLKASGDCGLDPISAGELPAGLAPSAEGWLRILPGWLAEKGGADGFFVARFVRNSGG
ncbi:MAG: RsmB/NOP family class I SAM-dependent RNA methyltransferase [Sphingomonadaceae bacterium]